MYTRGVVLGLGSLLPCTLPCPGYPAHTPPACCTAGTNTCIGASPRKDVLGSDSSCSLGKVAWPASSAQSGHRSAGFLVREEAGLAVKDGRCLDSAR